MPANGKRQPPRPSIEIVAPNASPEEAAAIAAALEQFLQDTAPTITTEEPQASPWARAAILEGVGMAAPTPWGDVEAWN
jgi:hypothetical protein